jgi:hypothetical protein
MPHEKKEKMTGHELSKYLAHFTGTDQYHKITMGSLVLGTDGIAAMIQKVGAGWLADAIMSYQLYPAIRKLPFQLWVLTVKTDKDGNSSALLTVQADKGAKVLRKQQIGDTDFPEGVWKFYLADQPMSATKVVKILMLPSEY